MYSFFVLKAPLVLFPFCFFDLTRKRWVRARYVAERHEIEARYSQWEIIGAPEIRSRGYATMFSPWAALAPLKRSAHLPPVEEPLPEKEPPEREPPIMSRPIRPSKNHRNGLRLVRFEGFLVLLLLRVYVAFCARRRKFAQINGAAKLFAKVGASREDDGTWFISTAINCSD